MNIILKLRHFEEFARTMAEQIPPDGRFVPKYRYFYNNMKKGFSPRVTLKIS